MRKEDQRHLKLNEVYKQLTAIKNQLQAIIQPLPQPELIKVNSRHELIPQKNGRVQPNQINQGLKNIEFTKQKSKQTLQTQQITQKQTKNTHIRSFFSPTKDSHPQNNTRDQTQKSLFDNKAGKNNRSYPPNVLSNMEEKLQFIPKIKFNSQKKDHKTIDKETPQHFTKNQHPTRRKFTHGRHATQFQFQKQDRSNIKKERLQTENAPIVEKKKQESKAEMYKGNNGFPTNSNKRLIRMRSDFTGSEKDEQMKMLISQRSKEQQLEAQLQKKQESISFMMSELHEIQKNFKQLENTLSQILAHHDKFQGKLTDFDVRQALVDIINKLDYQTKELTKLNSQCQRLQKINGQYELSIQTLQQRNIQSEKTIHLLTLQNQRYSCQLQTISSKLEVAVSENKLKDEFIVKLLSSRSESIEESVSTWLHQTLDSYLSRCGYPSNRLLQKLRQEESEIHRLKALLDEK